MLPNFLAERSTQAGPAQYMYCEALHCCCPITHACVCFHREVYGVTTGPYMPHLSLLYADITDEKKHEVGISCLFLRSHATSQPAIRCQNVDVGMN